MAETIETAEASKTQQPKKSFYSPAHAKKPATITITIVGEHPTYSPSYNDGVASVVQQLAEMFDKNPLAALFGSRGSLRGDDGKIHAWWRIDKGLNDRE